MITRTSNFLLKPLLILAIAVPAFMSAPVTQAEAGSRDKRAAIIAGVLIGGAIGYSIYKRKKRKEERRIQHARQQQRQLERQQRKQRRANRRYREREYGYAPRRRHRDHYYNESRDYYYDDRSYGRYYRNY